MTTEQEIAIFFDDILEKYFNEIKKVAHEENSQANAELSELLNDGVKKHIGISLSVLVKMYEEYISPNNAHVQNALELIPLFGAFGMWIGAQLGVTHAEYYKIVDYYLERFDLLEKD